MREIEKIKQLEKELLRSIDIQGTMALALQGSILKLRQQNGCFMCQEVLDGFKALAEYEQRTKEAMELIDRKISDLENKCQADLTS